MSDPSAGLAENRPSDAGQKGPKRLLDDKDFWKIYEKGETIGRGHFAKVKLVRHRGSGGFFAAKILDKGLEEHQEDYESMMREFQVLRELQHKNIVKLQDAYETPSSLILVCELATGGTPPHLEPPPTPPAPRTPPAPPAPPAPPSPPFVSPRHLSPHRAAPPSSGSSRQAN